MIVIAIVALLLSIALPSYQDYSIRARVTEGVSVAASAKTAVSTTCSVDPSVNPTNSSVGYSFAATEFVQSVVVSNTCAEPWIVVRTRNTGASDNVVISLDGYFNRGAGRIIWHCHRVSGEEAHIPRHCHGPHGWGSPST